MIYSKALCSSEGRRSHGNQDAVLLKTGTFGRRQVLLAAVCDGVGGLSDGEEASSFVILQLSSWFDRRLPKLLTEVRCSQEVLMRELLQCLVRANESILRSTPPGTQRATTAVILFLIGRRYFFFNVGDSRIYRADPPIFSKNKQIIQMTEDQSAPGNLLLECIGIRPVFHPQTGQGHLRPGSAFLLCSDGLYKRNTDLNSFGMHHADEQEMKLWLAEQVQLLREAGEADDISAVCISCGKGLRKGGDGHGTGRHS